MIKFDDQQSLETWFAAINEVLNETTKGYFELVSRKKEGEVVESKILYQQAIYGALLTQQTEFHSICSITENAFLDQVDTGDVLLFRSNN